jgi:menaquinone-9 beta-reductase
VSRFTLDFALAEHFQLLGGELRVGERASPPAAPGTVWASGRRARAAHGDWRWFGLKIHARNVALDADLEMHLAPNAYVGLCRLADGEVNVCGLFRRAARSNTDSPEGVPARAPYVKGQKRHGVSLATAPTPAVTSIEWLRGAPGSPLARKLERADLDYDSLCAVAGLSLAPEAVDPAQCRIGDALTMIPPITGNGMSMAFESAEIACGPLTEYARGAWSWSEASAEIATQLQTAFARWASVLHRLLFSPTGRAAMPLVARSNAFWRATFNATR